MANENGTWGNSRQQARKGEVSRNSNQQGQGQGRKFNKKDKRRKKAKNNNWNPLNEKKDAREQAKKPAVNRPKWKAPELSTTPIPQPLCPICGKPVEDLASAINDKASGAAAHFDCIKNKISANEILGEGETLSYIGGGRFGIISVDSKNKRVFEIKKIIEWESADNRADWRNDIADHFSLT